LYYPALASYYPAPALYYKDVRHSRFISVLAVFFLAAVPGCDRGSRPENSGRPAPDFTVSDSKSTIHLANYRGQIVLLNFWATWCPPCVQEMPGLIQLHHDRPDLAILAVSIDEDEDTYTNYIQRRHIDLITVRDPAQTAAKLYHTEGWPETYIIDRQGIIRRKIVGDPDWSNPELRAYLKTL
jgi:cytochrome c biogenesis protein CcmG/thiol:disulfide interchange protein DsbE